MKLGSVTKLDNRNTDGDVTLANFDVIVIFLIYDQFGSICKETVTLYLTKTGKRNKKSLTQLSYYCFE